MQSLNRRSWLRNSVWPLSRPSSSNQDENCIPGCTRRLTGIGKAATSEAITGSVTITDTRSGVVQGAAMDAATMAATQVMESDKDRCCAPLEVWTGL
jgi:hypothetical protein